MELTTKIIFGNIFIILFTLSSMCVLGYFFPDFYANIFYNLKKFDLVIFLCIILITLIGYYKIYKSIIEEVN